MVQVRVQFPQRPYLLFLPIAYRDNNQRRMGGDDRAKNRHIDFSPLASRLRQCLQR